MDVSKPVTPPISQRAAPSQSGSAAGKAAAAERTARDFEAVFLSQMLESMWSGIKTDGPFGGGSAEGQWRSMLNQEYARKLAEQGGIGIADQLKSQLQQMDNENGIRAYRSGR
jgi:Rod binding domain-containing protein